MFSIGLLLLFFCILSLNGQQIYRCDFDYGENCLPGLLSQSFVLFNETSEEPQQPASDVTAIETSNDQGDCLFPYPLNSFEMFFCEKTDVNLPATCPTLNSTGFRLNCSEGEYGYEKFEMEQIGIRSYKVDLKQNLLSGEHCIEFFYYLSNEYSNASINVIIEDNQSNLNQTILQVSQRLQNRWHQIRHDFYLNNDNPIIYFQFQRQSSIDLLPFYLAIDQITIIDLQCEPFNTTTMITTTTTTIITTSTTTTQSSTSSTLTTSSSTTSTSSTTISVSPTTTTTSSTTSISRTSTSTSQTSLSTSRETTSTLLLTSTMMSSSSSTTTTTTTTMEGSSSSPKQIQSTNLFFILLISFLLFL